MAKKSKKYVVHCTITFIRWGAECVAGTIPAKIWKYIQKECDGKASVYAEKLDNEEVPEEFRVINCMSEGSEGDNQIFSAYGPNFSDTTRILVSDDEKCEEEYELDDADTADDKFTVCKPPKGKHVYVWRSEEKGSWTTDIEIDEPFDISNLQLILSVLKLNGKTFRYVTGFKYGDVVVDCLEPETDGFSYELDFY